MPENENLPENQEETPGGNEPVITEKGEGTAPINVNVGVKFTILKTNLVAALQKDDKKWQVLVAPTDAVASRGMSIKEIVAEIQNLMGGGQEAVAGLEDQLSGAVESMSDQKSGSFDPMSIEFYLRQVFVYYEKEGEKSSAEYAFSIEVNTSQMLKQLGVFNLEGIVLSVWNTKRNKVKERMSMFDIDTYLAELQ